MKHARPDYARIQDPDHLIPENEPVFIIRGQDVAGPETLRQWAAIAQSYGAKSNIIEAALEQANAMDDWQQEHGHRVPDMP